MTRFFGMILVLAGLMAGLVLLAAGCYLAAGWLGWGFARLAPGPEVSPAAVFKKTRKGKGKKGGERKRGRRRRKTE